MPVSKGSLSVIIGLALIVSLVAVSSGAICQTMATGDRVGVSSSMSTSYSSDGAYAESAYTQMFSGRNAQYLSLINGTAHLTTATFSGSFYDQIAGSWCGVTNSECDTCEGGKAGYCSGSTVMNSAMGNGMIVQTEGGVYGGLMSKSYISGAGSSSTVAQGTSKIVTGNFTGTSEFYNRVRAVNGSVGMVFNWIFY